MEIQQLSHRSLGIFLFSKFISFQLSLIFCLTPRVVQVQRACVVIAGYCLTDSISPEQPYPLELRTSDDPYASPSTVVDVTSY